MQTTEPLTHPAGPDTAAPAPRADRAPERSTDSPRLADALDLLEAVPVAGPPAILLVAPLVLFALAVAGPFLLLLTIVAAMVAATALVALAAAVLASPYLIVRHLRGHRVAIRGRFRVPAPRPVRVHSRRVAA